MLFDPVWCSPQRMASTFLIIPDVVFTAADVSIVVLSDVVFTAADVSNVGGF